MPAPSPPSCLASSPGVFSSLLPPRLLFFYEYDTLSANVVKSFPKLAKSESGQIVSEKVKLTYFDVYLSHTM